MCECLEGAPVVCCWVGDFVWLMWKCGCVCVCEVRYLEGLGVGYLVSQSSIVLLYVFCFFGVVDVEA